MILVTFDVKNVFNSAPWRLIDAAVAGFGLPAYFRRIIRLVSHRKGHIGPIDLA